MADEAQTPNPVVELATQISRARDADVLLYNGRIDRPFDDTVIDLVRKRRRRTNILLMLSTYGGNPDAAYRIARCLQTHYTKFTVVVAGFCKSAGTLIVLGANSVMLLDQAELGPLDVQIRKDDELAEASSGLTPSTSLTSLREAAMEAFVGNYIRLKGGLLMTTKTAAEIASGITVGLYQPIMAQLDPMRLGEMERAVKVAWEYGNRLTQRSQNLKEDALGRLVAGYPSHEFVIDREEAKDLFKNVEDPADSEKAFCELAHTMNRTPLHGPTGPYIFFMSQEIGDDDKPKDVDNADAHAEELGAGEGSPSGEGSNGGPPPARV